MLPNADWLGLPEAAAKYSVSVSLLRREAVAGKLRTRRLYGRVLVRPEWLDQWFQTVSGPEMGGVVETEQSATAA